MKREELKRKSKRVTVELRRLGTEKTNSASVDLDRKSALEIARIINAEDAKVAAAVKGALRQIAQAIDLNSLTFLQDFSLLVQEPNGLELYHRNGLPPLPTNPIPPGLPNAHKLCGAATP